MKRDFLARTQRGAEALGALADPSVSRCGSVAERTGVTGVRVQWRGHTASRSATSWPGRCPGTQYVGVELDWGSTGRPGVLRMGLSAMGAKGRPERVVSAQVHEGHL